ncbi:MAG: hypothetical protein WD042_08015 [Phycisphaeraceae bacterium]
MFYSNNGIGIPGLIVATGLLVMGSVTMTGCEDDNGPLEEAGEAIDDAAKDVKEGVEDAADEVEDKME